MKNFHQAQLLKSNDDDSKIAFLEDGLTEIASIIARAEKENWQWLHACFSIMAVLVAQQLNEELTKINRRH